VVESQSEDVLVGVSYFAGWWRELPNKWHGQGWKIGQPDWRKEYPGRVPTLGHYNEQATMDREIIAASEHGVDFFAMLWYFPKPGSKETENAPKLNRGLEQFIASPEAHRMRFFIEYCNSPRFSAEGDGQWAECIPTWVQAMKNRSYLRVDGRLVFKVHGINEFLRANDNDIETCRRRLDILRRAVRDAGLGDHRRRDLRIAPDLGSELATRYDLRLHRELHGCAKDWGTRGGISLPCPRRPRP
jgi:hypothetical protein